MKTFNYLIFYDRSHGTWDPLFRLHRSLPGAKKAVEQIMAKTTKEYGDTWQQIAKKSHFWQWESDGGEYISITKMQVRE